MASCRKTLKSRVWVMTLHLIEKSAARFGFPRRQVIIRILVFRTGSRLAFLLFNLIMLGIFCAGFIFGNDLAEIYITFSLLWSSFYIR